MIDCAMRKEACQRHHRRLGYYLLTCTLVTVGLWGSACRQGASTGASGGSALPARVHVATREDGSGTEVSFFGGSITASVVSSVTDWPAVVSLRLQECNEVDASLWNAVRRSKNLQKLELIRVPVTDDDLRAVSELPHLEDLLLGNVPCTGEGLQHLTQVPLRRLEIHSRDVTAEGLRRVVELSSLRELQLHCPGVELANFPSFVSLSQLETLNAGRTPLGAGGVHVLKDHPSLKVLLLNASGMDDTQLAVFNTIANLTDLTLVGAAITDEGLQQLQCPRLKRLFLDTCLQITDQGLYHLAGLPQLEELLLMGTSVAGLDFLGLAESRLFQLRRVFITADQFRGDQQSLDRLREKLPACQVIITQG